MRLQLRDQLPRPMAADGFLYRYVTIFDEIMDSVQGRVDEVEHYFDPDVAPLDLVKWMSVWTGLHVEGEIPEARRRALLRRAGEVFAWKGTRRGLHALLEAVTGGDVEISDSGGPVGRDAAADLDPRIEVRLETTGGLSVERIHEILRHEIPVDVTVTLDVRDRLQDSDE